VSGRRAELFVVWTMRILALAFFVVGISFIADPDGTITRIADVGAGLGDFAEAPLTDQRLWLALAFAYMMVIAVLALLASLDVARYRALLLVLVVAKASSSLAALWFFLGEDVFVYLVNFVVDGLLALLALACWALAGKVSQRRPLAAG
jgi:hypothetical protein